MIGTLDLNGHSDKLKCRKPVKTRLFAWRVAGHTHLNLWMHTLIELWAWDQSGRQLVDRRDSPWDDAARRPSHANRRKALRRQILRNELSTITTAWSLPREIIQLAESLMTLAD